MSHDLRLELRARNNVLWHAIFDAYPTVAAFCRAHGLNQCVVGEYLNLAASPYRSNGRLTKQAQRTADALQRIGEDLFPPALYTVQLPRRMVAEVASAQFLSLAAARRLALPDVQDPVETREAHDALCAALETLTPREEMVLKLHYGLDDGVEYTYDEIGQRFDLTRMRIYQIEARALRKLRWPSRACKLLPFAE